MLLIMETKKATTFKCLENKIAELRMAYCIHMIQINKNIHKNKKLKTEIKKLP